MFSLKIGLSVLEFLFPLAALLMLGYALFAKQPVVSAQLCLMFAGYGFCYVLGEYLALEADSQPANKYLLWGQLAIAVGAIVWLLYSLLSGAPFIALLGLGAVWMLVETVRVAKYSRLPKWANR